MCQKLSRAPQQTFLFDHLVGTQDKRRRDRESNRVCSLHIDNKLELGYLIDRDVTRRCAFKDLINVPRRTTEYIRKIDRVGHETTGFNKPTKRINRRQSVLLGQLDDQSTVRGVFRVCAHIERVRVLLHRRLEHASILRLLDGPFEPWAK